MRVPSDYEVRPLVTENQRRAAKDLAQCGTCGRYWDDGISTGITPVPSGRCPFEYFHGEPDRVRYVIVPDSAACWNVAPITRWYVSDDTAVRYAHLHLPKAGQYRLAEADENGNPDRHVAYLYRRA